jgi:hypothetical protein
MTCNVTRSGFSFFRNRDNAGVLQIYLMTFGTEILSKDIGYTMCPDDTATAGSWAGIGLVN